MSGITIRDTRAVARLILVPVLLAGLATAGCEMFQTELPGTQLRQANELHAQGSYLSMVRAHKKFSELANQGNAEAQYKLGRMYAEGTGAPLDGAVAARWYRTAADQGHAGAQYDLAVFNYEGTGIPKDNVKAYMWAILAASNSTGATQENALSLRDEITARITASELSKARRMARQRKPGLAAATTAPTRRPPTRLATRRALPADIEGRLGELKTLRDRRLISGGEYTEMREKIVKDYIESRLRMLKELYDDGLISDDELAEERKEALRGM